MSVVEIQGSCPFNESLHTTTQIPPTFKDKGKSPTVEIYLPKNHQQEDELPHDYHDWYDTRPESPIPYHELVSEVESEESDCEYEPESEDTDDELDPKDFVKGYEPNEKEQDDEVFEEVPYADSEELHIVRDGVKKRKQQLLDLALELQKEAEKGNLGGGFKASTSTKAAQNHQDGAVSEYEGSEDEIHTPTDSDEEGGTGRSRRSRRLLVTADTDWSTFAWKVGQRFTTREAFRAAMAHFAIAQGRNLSIVTITKQGTIEASTSHFEATAQPTRTGRGGRVIRGGVGSRGGTSRGGRGGTNRGGRGWGRQPQGVGVLIDKSGSAFVHMLGQKGGPREVTQAQTSMSSGCPMGSQSSSAAQL